MKRVPFVTACLIAALNFLSVSAQKQQQLGDRLSIADTVHNAANFTADSLLVYNYINQSKNCIDKSPDSSLLLADLAIKLHQTQTTQH